MRKKVISEKNKEVEKIINKYLPKTFYSGLKPETRLKYLVEHWQNAVKIIQIVEEKLGYITELLNNEEKENEIF